MSNLVEVAKILEDIKNTSGKKAKKDILYANADNKLLMEILKFTLNDQIVTNIARKKLDKEIDGTVRGFIYDTNNYMNFLKNTCTGKDEHVAMVQAFIKAAPLEAKWVLEEIALGQMKIGMSAKSVNEALNYTLIQTWEIMLAKSFEKEQHKVTGEFALTMKIDGNRTIAWVSVDGVKFFSRTGQQIHGLIQLEDEFVKLPTGVYDGEIILKNDGSMSSDKLFRATQKVIKKDGSKFGLDFMIFDVLTFDDFHNGESEKTYAERRIYLDNQIWKMTNVDNDLQYVHVLPTLYVGSDTEKINYWMDYAMGMGMEGLMLNRLDAKWVAKRSDAILKVKKFFSCDGIVQSIYEGDAKYKGMLGGVRITFNHKQVGDITVNIGSGFTDKERKEFWDNPELVIGKVAEYQYFELSENQKGGVDLRFATWKGLRHDKTIEDVNYE